MYAAVIHAKPELAKKEIVATLMSGLNESQPAVVPHLWHAVLTTVTSVPVSLLILVWPWHSNLCSMCPFLCILVELEWRCRHWKHSCTWFTPTGVQWWLWSCQADISLFASHSIPCLCSSMCAKMHMCVNSYITTRIFSSVVSRHLSCWLFEQHCSWVSQWEW